MESLYLDNNIISYLHHPENYVNEPWKENIPLILDYFNETSDLSVLYSPAHLMDVRKGYLKDQQRAIEKLRFISYLTRKRRIAKYFHSGQVTVEEIDPEAFFLQDTENNIELHAPGRRKLNYLPLIHGNPAYERLKDKFIDFPKVERALAAVPIKLKRTKKSPTVYNLMCDFAVFIGEIINNDFPLYKPFREQAILQTGIAGKIAELDDPLSMIHTLLTATSLGQRILEGMNELMADDDPNNQEGAIFCLFMNLDFLGFKKDRITGNHGYMNIAADATHCFYASYCDLFVTNDKNTAKKAAAVYKYLGFNTKVTDMIGLVEWIEQRKARIPHVQKIF